MPKIHYAVEIHFPDLTATDATIGMVNDGDLGYSVIRFITDRPGYDGNDNPYPTNEDTTDNTAVWYEDFLTRDGMSNPSRRVDLTGTGDYGTLSGFDFTVENTMVAASTKPFWKRAQDSGCYWTNKTVKVYAVIADVFYQIWQGIVSNNPYTETEFKCVCKSDFTAVHKPLPPTVISDTNYPAAIDDSKGKAIPVCIGKVSYAQLFNIDGLAEDIVLVNNNGDEYKTAQAKVYSTTNSDSAVLTLITDGVTFADNDLQGYYLKIMSGGGSPDTNKLIRITLSEHTINSDGHDTIRIWISEQLGIAPATFNANYVHGSTTFADVWQFKVCSLGTNNIVSNGAIYGFKDDNYNRIRLFNYSSDESNYDDVQHAIVSTQTTAPASVETASNNLTVDGELDYLFPVLLSHNNEITNTEPAAVKTGTEDDVFDIDRSTSYTVGVASEGAPTEDVLISITVPFNADISKASVDYDSLTLGVDCAVNPQGLNWNLSISATFYDQYGDHAGTMTVAYPTSGDTSGTVDLNFLPDDYYLNNGDTNSEISTYSFELDDFGNPATMFALSSTLRQLIKDGVISKRIDVRLILTVKSVPNSVVPTLSLKEIGFFGVRSIDTIGTNLYTRVNGEMVGGTESTSVYKAFKLILETYDGIASANIDYGNLSSYRALNSGYRWVVGRQLTERKNSFEYLKELCADSFVAMFTDRSGKKKLSAWLDNHTVARTHNATSIMRDSITSFEKTQATDLYNDFYLKYAYSPGPGKCAKAFMVTKLTETSFPLSSSEDWKLYVGGLSNASYTDAKFIWEWCRAAYERMGVVRQFERELLWFPDLYTYEDNASEIWGCGTDSSAYYFLRNALEWVTREKAEVTYEIALSAANITTELCDYVSFTDAIYTNGTARYGWIELIEYDVKKDTIIVKPILKPSDGIDEELPGDIVETGIAPDTITETGSAPDTITEDGAA